MVLVFDFRSTGGKNLYQSLEIGSEQKIPFFSILLISSAIKNQILENFIAKGRVFFCGFYLFNIDFVLFQNNEVEEDDPQGAKKIDAPPTPNILELGLVSKSTLANLGIKLRGEKEDLAIDNIEQVQDEKEIQEIDYPVEEAGLYFFFLAMNH